MSGEKGKKLLSLEEIMDKLEESDDENFNFNMVEGTKSIASDDSLGPDSLDEGKNKGEEENRVGGGMETETE